MTMCANHPEMPAAAYCRECGKPLCGECRQEAMGVIYCSEHVPASRPSFSGSGIPPEPPPDFRTSTVGPSPYTSPGQDASPALALLLGTIPGVGAIYNGQYAKGLIHAVIFGLLISVLSTNPGAPIAIIVSFLMAGWWFYMVLEAYHTARKRREGLPVDEFSSLFNLQGPGERPVVGAFILIGLGLLFLLNTTGLIGMDEIARYWPILLIAAGAWMLYVRTSRRDPVPPPEFSNERH